jgi:methionyl-tRNA formyltransferase
MSKTSKTVIFFGNERLATGVSTEAPTLQALIEAGYKVAAVVSNFEKGTSRAARSLEIAEVAHKHKIPLLLPKKLSEIHDQLEGYNADIGVLVAYGRIVSERIINLFPHGIVNIHPSLLPRHRGPTPIESVMLSGEEKTGVSIMRLAKAMDAGPVFGQSEVKLQGDETKQALADNLLEIGSSMLIELLPGILDGSIVALPQNDTRATYDQLIAKQAGRIDWQKPAILLEREIRAFQEWPKSSTVLMDKEVIITKARAVASKPADAKPGDIGIAKEVGVIMVATSSGTLCIEQLKPAGKKEMSAKAFLAGYKTS